MLVYREPLTLLVRELLTARHVLDENDLIQVQLHGHGCRKGCNHERRGNDEPRYGRQANTAEGVQQVDEEQTNDQLDRECDPQSESKIQSELDDQENKVEQRRWTELFNETHLQLLHFFQEK